MIGIASKSTGFFISYNAEEPEVVIDVINNAQYKPSEFYHQGSIIQDWEPVEGKDDAIILQNIKTEYWLNRAASYFRIAIEGIEDSVEKEILEYIEELISTRDISNKVIDRLLIAPFKNPEILQDLSKKSLSYGFAVTASIFDELLEYQPQLNRFVAIWLEMPRDVFKNFTESKEIMWQKIVEDIGIMQFLKAEGKNDFVKLWNPFVFSDFSEPKSCSGWNMLGQAISNSLFPQEKDIQLDLFIEKEECENASSNDFEIEKKTSDHDTYEKVIKQVKSIAKEIAKGRDSKADKYLKQLIKKQISSPKGEKYAVKSLCNIAKLCADMFRMDFERICLDEAMKIHPNDSWLRIQFGDHLKRVGKYTEALQVLHETKCVGKSDPDIIQSSIADVYSQMEDYEKAISTYKAITDWENKAIVRTAIADNYRRMGLLDDAERNYHETLLHSNTYDTIRARVGLAEIAKKQGDLQKADSLYADVVAQEKMEDMDKIIINLGWCNVLKLLERYEDAYKIVNKIIQQFPFVMEAKMVRGSLLGLMGKAQEGLEDFGKNDGNEYFRKWQEMYYRGLLLFKLEQYKDAKEYLVEELNNTALSNEGKSVLRMAAALCFLREGSFSEADGFLSSIGKIHDYYGEYLELVMKLHSATQKNDLETISKIKEKIESINSKGGDSKIKENLKKAVLFINERNSKAAIELETDVLLALTA